MPVYESEVIKIEKVSVIDWNAIRAEYIGGGTSQRKLAEKYGIAYFRIKERCAAEGWVKAREDATREALAKAAQKTAETASDNAAIAARIRTKLLRKLEREIDALPDLMGSETANDVQENEYSKDGKKVMRVKKAGKVFKLRDLAAAYKDLTADMQMGADENDIEDLSPLVELLK